MKKKIAIPIENGKLCSHFGHCEYFYVATVNDGKIELEQDITPPAHEPGLYPKWVGDLGVKCVIAGGMGEKAQNLFRQENIELFIGAEEKAPSDLINDYISGHLETGANSCNHHHAE